MLVFDPDLTHLGLLDSVERTNLVLFAAVPQLPVHSTVAWPNPDDHVGFVDAAVKAGATILYIDRLPLDELRIANEEETLGAGHPLVAELRSHEGETMFVVAMWILHGIGHELTVEAEWYADLDSRLSTASVAAADQASAEQRAEHDALVAELANLPAFAAATNDAGRSIAIDNHLGGLLAFRGGPRLVQEVKDRFNADVLPGIEAAMASEARSLLAEKRSKKDVAAALGIGPTRLDHLLARYPGP